MTIIITEIVDRGPAGRWKEVWPVEHVAALRRHAAAADMSRNQIAAAINHEFKTDYSRNAIIGKCKRVGLVATKKIGWQKGKPRKPRARPARTERETFKAPPNVDFYAQQVGQENQHAPCEPLRISITELTDDTCKWPLWDGADDKREYCGCPAIEGLPFCSSHCQIAYREPERRQR